MVIISGVPIFRIFTVYDMLLHCKSSSHFFINKSTTCGCQCLAVATFRKFYFVKKIEGLPPLLVGVPLLIVNNNSEFQVNIFGNNKDIRKGQSFRT